MREAGGAKGIDGKVKAIEDSVHKSDNGNMSTEISPDKQTAAAMMQQQQ